MNELLKGGQLKHKNVKQNNQRYTINKNHVQNVIQKIQIN